MDYQFAKLWSARTEVNYQSLGGGEDKPSHQIPLGGFTKYVFEYLTLPLLLKFKLPVTGLALYAGPQYGYLTTSRFRTIYGPGENINAIRRSALSVVLGTEYFLPIKKSRNEIGLSGRYQFDISNIGKNPGHSDTYMRNRAVIFALGYRLKL